MGDEQKATAAKAGLVTAGAGGFLVVNYVADKAAPIAAKMADSGTGQLVLGAIVITAIVATAYVLRFKFPSKPIPTDF